MHKKGLTQAEIGLTQPENRPNSNFWRVVVCSLQESAEKNPGFEANILEFLGKKLKFWENFTMFYLIKVPIH